MTIGCIISIIIGGIILIGGIVAGIYAISEVEVSVGVTTLLFTLLLSAAMIVSPIIYMKTEAGQRALKDQHSNFGDGIDRTVEVYDVNGELIKTYTGKFDVETSNGNGAPYIVFDDENDKRHIIYYTTGTIIIDEK